MKKGRIIFGTVITLIVVMLAILPTVSSAATLNPKLYFGVTERKTSDTLKFGYSIGNPGNSTTGQKIWNIVKFSSNAYSDPTDTYDIYCIRSGYGFTNGTSMTRNREYTDQFDMKADRGSIGDNQVTALNTRTATVDGQIINSYDAVLALADLFYIPGVSNSGYKSQLLDNANDKYADVLPIETYLLDDTQIQAIQQAAMWFYTNSDGEIYTEHYGNPATKNGWLNYTSDGAMYAEIDNYNPTGEIDANNKIGVQIENQAMNLYNYLISEAAERVKAGTYNSKTKVTLYTNLTTNVEQPLIKIEQTGDFDLALRKYITKVNGTAVTNTRVPNIDTGTIDTNGTATYSEDILESIENGNKTEKEIVDERDPDDDTDPFLMDAIQTVVETGQASTSFIQRRFKVGHARAGRIIDQMEERGVISGYQGSKPREVLMTLERLNELKMGTTPAQTTEE